MKIVAVGYVDREMDEKACIERDAAEKAAAAKAAATAKPPVVPPASPAAASPALPLEGDARLQQIAVARAGVVRGFLVEQGKVDPARVSARAGNIHAKPSKKSDAQPRVEFARAGE